ncbi:MAG: hypothetical protein R3E01_22110 [Pirellulaceae bacterium]|nr:hypothetical protein [Planctomycetales bacterium]MCA9266375.1 hypothetical protein [Planctomycetales bacterium]
MSDRNVILFLSLPQHSVKLNDQLILHVDRLPVSFLFEDFTTIVRLVAASCTEVLDGTVKPRLH